MLAVGFWTDPSCRGVSFWVQDSLRQKVPASPTLAVVLVRLGDYTARAIRIGNRIAALGSKENWNVGHPNRTTISFEREMLYQFSIFRK